MVYLEPVKVPEQPDLPRQVTTIQLTLSNAIPATIEQEPMLTPATATESTKSLEDNHQQSMPATAVTATNETYCQENLIPRYRIDFFETESTMQFSARKVESEAMVTVPMNDYYILEQSATDSDQDTMCALVEQPNKEVKEDEKVVKHVKDKVKEVEEIEEVEVKELKGTRSAKSEEKLEGLKSEEERNAPTTAAGQEICARLNIGFCPFQPASGHSHHDLDLLVNQAADLGEPAPRCIIEETVQHVTEVLELLVLLQPAVEHLLLEANINMAGCLRRKMAHVPVDQELRTLFCIYYYPQVFKMYYGGRDLDARITAVIDVVRQMLVVRSKPWHCISKGDWRKFVVGAEGLWGLCEVVGLDVTWMRALESSNCWKQLLAVCGWESWGPRAVLVSNFTSTGWTPGQRLGQRDCGLAYPLAIRNFKRDKRGIGYTDFS
ncbi:hypothetical protein BDR26DRAFT_918649 [Obelidium mucronatum]|nr:hypothetical protein BDR26DRAFT_918649 [Obelidium mucronatum]